MLGSLIAGASSLIGGFLGQKSVDKQLNMQKKLAQNQIQWKAADAEKAGISKIYAMGAPSMSFSPVSTGGPLGAAVADAGQHIGRAAEAYASPTTKLGNVSAEIAKAQLDGLKVDNEIKRQELASKIAVRTQPGTPPSLLDSETTPSMPGQGNSGIKLQKQMSPAGYLAQKSFGVSPEVDMYRTSKGFSPEVPQDLGEAQESQPLAAAQWFLRNKLLPGYFEDRRTYPYPAPSGHYWMYNPVLGEYTLHPDWKPGSQPRTWRDMMDKLRR